MALIKCEECGQMVSDKAVACPHCGCPVENQTKSSKSDQNDLEVTDTSLDVSGSPTNEDNYDKPSSEEQELSYDYGQDDSESSWERDIKKRKRLRWILGIAAVLLTIVGVDAWLYMQTSNDDVEENTVSSTNTTTFSEYTVDGVASALLNCADESSTISLLDDIKAQAEHLLNVGNQDGYFNIIRIIRTVWMLRKDALITKFPSLAEKIKYYIEVPETLKTDFAKYLAQNAANSVVDMDIDANNSNVSDVSETNEQQDEKERLEREKANSINQFVGQYTFSTKREILGRIHYLIVEVLPDGRITQRTKVGDELFDRNFLGNIKIISDHAFMIPNAKVHILNESFRTKKGYGSNLHRASDMVFDINENRTYLDLDAYNNRDISDPDYFDFTRN